MQMPISASRLLENLIAVSDPHASFDETDDALVEEGERRLLQQHFGVAELGVHLLCVENVKNVNKGFVNTKENSSTNWVCDFIQM